MRFCGAAYEVMLAPSLEIERSVAARKHLLQWVKQKERKLCSMEVSHFNHVPHFVGEKFGGMFPRFEE